MQHIFPGFIAGGFLFIGARAFSQIGVEGSPGGGCRDKAGSGPQR
jgi:hypothetical protein